METRILNAIRERVPAEADPLLKMTSLEYLRDALERERFEECPWLVENAKSYGASRREIRHVIAQYLRKLDSGQGGAGAYRSRIFT